MSAPWKPGDVAVLTWYADEPMISLRVGGQCGHFGKAEHWHTERGTHGVSPDIVRRLVVIDPESAEDVERLLRLWVNTDPGQAEWGRLLNNLTAALREFANPTPPIEEPQGLGAVVEDAEGADWHRTREGRWIAEDGLRTRAGGWGHINQPARLVTEGVTP